MNDIADAMEAGAYAAKSVRAEVVPVFRENRFSARLRKVSGANIFESGSPISSACGSTLAEKRSVSVVNGARPEEMSMAASMRIPAVILNMPRTAGFQSLNADSSDVMLIKDSGAIIFLPENNQEILDNMIQAYRICEDNKVLLPAVINAEMWEAREVVQIPSEQAVENMLPKLRLPVRIDTKKPASFGLPVDDHSGQKAQQMKAMDNSVDVMRKTFEKWDEKFHRKYGFFESYKLEDAAHVFVVAGRNSGTVKSAVDALREKGEKAGMLRVRVLRPMVREIHDMLKGRSVAVIDSCGMLSEIQSQVTLITSGKRLSEKDVADLMSSMKKSETGRFWL